MDVGPDSFAFLEVARAWGPQKLEFRKRAIIKLEL